jgi:cell division initiation protein
MAALTPLDILQKQFAASRKAGYDPDEVQAFLDAVRESWEGSLKDAQRLREEIRGLQAEVDKLRGEQDELKDTLILARRLAVDLESNARREADLVIGEARLEAERILATTHDEERKLQDTVVRLKSARLHHIAEMRALVEAHLRLLDAYDKRD